MIGLIFHGPEVFDSGWAEKIINTVEPENPIRCVLAGTMGRTAVFDSGLSGIEFWDKLPGACLKELAGCTDAVLIVNLGKSVASGLVFGGTVADRSGVSIPVAQAECSGPFFVEWIKGFPVPVMKKLLGLGLVPKEKIKIEKSVWQENGKIHRRMNTADAGDFVLVDGIMVGRATGQDVVISCENKHICEIQGVEVKVHGIEKLDRLGGVDLETAKLASTPTIRRTSYTPRTMETRGRGMVFLDHAGMHVYGVMNNAQGVVTVGDDTTVIAADALSRFSIPVIGIVDGDEDVVLKNGCFAPGSVRITVKKDDEFGLKVLHAVFGGEKQINMKFSEALDKILKLAGDELVKKEHFDSWVIPGVA